MSHAIEQSVFTLGKCCLIGGEIVSLDCCDGQCKCCVTLKYRVWSIAHSGGLGFPALLEWEVTDGVETLSGMDKISLSGRYEYAGDFTLHTTSANAPIDHVRNPDPGWMTPDPADIDTQCEADEIQLTLGNSPFCGDTGRSAVFYGEDHWTETIHAEWVNGSELPSVYGADSNVRYKYGITEWHEVELCEK